MPRLTSVRTSIFELRRCGKNLFRLRLSGYEEEMGDDKPCFVKCEKQEQFLWPVRGLLGVTVRSNVVRLGFHAGGAAASYSIAGDVGENLRLIDEALGDVP